MKLKLTHALVLAALAASYGTHAQSNGDYRSVATGLYSTVATWERYDSVTTSWIVPANKPGSGSNVLVRSGHTVSADGTCNAKNLTVQNGATLKSDGQGQRSVRIAGVSLTNEGTIGGSSGADDSITLEVSTPGATTTFSGAGSTIVNRARILQNLIGTTLVIDHNITFNNDGVGLTAYYNNTSSAASEITTVTINAGKTVKLADSAVFHMSNSATTNPGGAYTYNINGTLDMSSSKRTTYIVPNSITSTSSTKVIINGLMKLGNGFSTSNSVAAAAYGTIRLDIAAGGTVDASANAKLNMDSTTFIMGSGTSVFKRIVAASDTLFPISLAVGGYNAVKISNSGTADTISVSLKNTFDGLTPDATKLVKRQWTISEATAGGSTATLKFYWLAADGATGFSASSVSVYRYDGTSWVAFPATVTGTGTLADPYAAAISGVTAFGRFVVGNSGLPTNVGISSVSKNGGSLTVAPNPVNGRTVRLQLDNLTAGTYHIAVYNVTGQIVAANDVVVAGKAVAHSIELPAHTAAGVYEVKVNNGEGKMAQRIIVQ